MTTQARVPVAGLALALGTWCLVAPATWSADDDDKAKIQEAQQKVLKLAEAAGGDAQKLAASLAKDADLGHVMHVFKPRDKGGVGVGSKAGGITPDSIELMIIAMAKKAPAKTELTKHAADYAKMADVTRAVAEVALIRVPAPAAGKKPEDWKKFSEQMKAGAQELKDTLKDADPKKLKAAAGKLNASCNDCHAIFRDE